MTNSPESRNPRTALSARRWLMAVCASLLMAFAVTPSFAEPIFPSGSSWGIEPPAGFALQADTGFFAHPSGALLIILNLPEPLDRSRFEKAMGTVEGQGVNAMRIESVSDAIFDEKPSFLVTERAPDGSKTQLILAVQGETAGAIVLSMPSAAMAATEVNAIRAALFSAQERSVDMAAKLEALPVKVNDIAGMRVSATIANIGVKLTDGDGNFVTRAPDQPFVTLMAVPVTLDEAPGRDEKHFAAFLEESLGTKVLATQKRIVGQVNAIEASCETQYEGYVRDGLAWTRTLGQFYILVTMEAPQGQKPDVARLERIWKGIALK